MQSECDNNMLEEFKENLIGALIVGKEVLQSKEADDFLEAFASSCMNMYHKLRDQNFKHEDAMKLMIANGRLFDLKVG